MSRRKCSKCGKQMRDRGLRYDSCSVCVRRKRYLRTCDTCGKVHCASEENPLNGAFCSKQCRQVNALQLFGADCLTCGKRFRKTDESAKWCSRTCYLTAMKQIPKTPCRWCGKEKAREDNKTCRGGSCNAERIKFVGWMKRKQKAYKQRLKPKYVQPTNATWDGWCLFAAMKGYQIKPLTLEQQWKRKCSSMAGANRHRLPNVRSKSITQKEPRTWSQVCKTIVSRIDKKSRGKTLEQCWREKMNSKASNQRKRIRRKTEMKRLQAERSSTD